MSSCFHVLVLILVCFSDEWSHFLLKGLWNLIGINQQFSEFLINHWDLLKPADGGFDTLNNHFHSNI